MNTVANAEEMVEIVELEETVEQDMETEGVRHLRIGIMPFARVHAASYAALLRDDPTVTLLCADPGGAYMAAGDETRGRPFAEQLGVDYVDSYTELLATGVNAVLVCSEDTRHRELLELAASRGAHVLYEKPLATTVAYAEAMVCHLRRGGRESHGGIPCAFLP